MFVVVIFPNNDSEVINNHQKKKERQVQIYKTLDTTFADYVLKCLKKEAKNGK